MPDKEDGFLKYILSHRGIRDNPYIEEMISILDGCSDLPSMEEALYSARADLVVKYSFSIPFPSILKEIKKYSPIVELGAGTGYFAWCLKRMGAEVTGIDLYSPDDESPFDFLGANQWFEDTWTLILSGDENSLGGYFDHSLLLCWPPPESAMALNAFEVFKNAGGRYLIYIGDPRSSAEKNFFSRLSLFRTVKETAVPSWKGINEILLIKDLKEKI